MDEAIGSAQFGSKPAPVTRRITSPQGRAVVAQISTKNLGTPCNHAGHLDGVFIGVSPAIAEEDPAVRIGTSRFNEHLSQL